LREKIGNVAAKEEGKMSAEDSGMLVAPRSVTRRRKARPGISPGFLDRIPVPESFADETDDPMGDVSSEDVRRIRRLFEGRER
jgi:hypothetical protein